MRIQNSRPQFPFLYPSVELNAPRSSKAHSIRGPLMENLESPAVADAGRQNSVRDFMPEMQKLESQRHHATGKRGRPAKNQTHHATGKRGRPTENSRVHKWKNCSPEHSRPIVLALSAVPPSVAKKRFSKRAPVLSAHDRNNQGTESTSRVWRTSPCVVSEVDHNNQRTESSSRVWKTAPVVGEPDRNQEAKSTHRVWKTAVNQDKGKAAETKTGPATSPKKDVSEHDRIFSSEPSSSLLIDSAKDGIEEDQKIFLEAIYAMQQVPPKRKR